jgi:hypothetical protein
MPKKTLDLAERAQKPFDPKVKINGDVVAALASFGVSTKDIATHLGISKATVDRRCQKDLERGRANRSISLRKKQWDVAMAGNVTMLIWLGKQLLGQSDRVDINGTGFGSDGAPITGKIEVTFVQATHKAPVTLEGKLDGATEPTKDSN